MCYAQEDKNGNPFVKDCYKCNCFTSSRWGNHEENLATGRCKICGDKL